jgi:hypothetical protein
MKLIAFGGLVLAFAVGCNQQQPADQSLPGNQMAFAPGTINLGNVPLSSELPFAAKLINKTGRLVEIAHVSTSCGCLNVQCPKHCEPRGEFEIRGRIRTGERPGKFSYSITLEQTDPEASPFKIELVGEARPDLVLTPGTVTLVPDFAEKRPGQATVTLENLCQEPISLQPPYDLPSGIEVTLEAKNVKPGNKCQIHISASAANLANIDCELRLPTSHSAQSLLLIPLQIRPANGLTITPPAIRLGIVKPQELTREHPVRVHLSGPALRLFSIKEVVTPSSLEHLATIPANDGEFDILLSLSSAFRKIDLSGEILIRLWPRDLATQSYGLNTVSIPVSGFLRY